MQKLLLNEIIADPSARLGRTLYEAVASGEIKNVMYIGQENGIAVYEKMQKKYLNETVMMMAVNI